MTVIYPLRIVLEKAIEAASFIADWAGAEERLADKESEQGGDRNLKEGEGE